MSGPIRVDWEKIKARWGSEVSELHLALVPKGFAQLVLAIQERLHWRATYRIDGYDFSDWDDLQAIVDYGLAGLTDTMRLSDLIQLLDDVEPLLAAIRDKDNCCDDAFMVDQMQDPGGVIQPLPDESGGDIVRGVGDPPGDVVDWPTYDARLCEAAQKLAAGLITWVRALEFFQGALSVTLAAAAGAVLASMAAVGIVGTVAAGALGGGIGALTWLDDIRELLGLENPWALAKDELQDPGVLRQITCAIVGGQSPEDAHSALQAALETYAPHAKDMLGLLPLQFMVNKVFNMETDSGGFGGPCDCEGEEVAIRGFIYEVHSFVASGGDTNASYIAFVGPNVTGYNIPGGLSPGELVPIRRSQYLEGRRIAAYSPPGAPAYPITPDIVSEITDDDFSLIKIGNRYDGGGGGSTTVDAVVEIRYVLHDGQWKIPYNLLYLDDSLSTGSATVTGKTVSINASNIPWLADRGVSVTPRLIL